jgi:hypothetical protein
MKIFTEIFGTYIITAMLVNGGIFYTFREWFKKQTPMLLKGNPPRHMIDCRMCTGFWISLATSLICGNLEMLPLICGVSYFLATQEK